MTRRFTASLMTGLAMMAILPCYAVEPGTDAGAMDSTQQVTHPSITTPTLSEANTKALLKLQALLHDHHPDQALTLVDQSLVDQPDNGSLLFLKALALTQLNRRADAIVVLKNLVERFPEMAAPYNNLAALYAADGDLDNARRTLEKAVRAQPNYATAQENLGDVYLVLARDAYTKALKLNPDNRALNLKLNKLN